ncbi:HEAT repeat-containing protein 1-like [Lytechinus pictus]|uniref:HEAT repeat-containing protein 1-like n=1 Tax=Lytechinus pictus TaxID=7653 RepID=UPI0030B9EEE0
MTSLAQQLQRLAVPEARAAVAAQRKDRRSLLFDPAEAGGLDKDTYYAIGVNGLQELQGIDPRFQDFESLLFDEASKSLERSIESRAMNDKLDKKIGRFLLNVSPYFLLKPAQKAIEWLVYRFHIHDYNTDELMMCVLPYHETKIFVRAVQLLSLKNKKGRWNWLEPIQKPGVSLSRLSLVTHCISDGGFLHFICELPLLAIKAHKKTVLPGGSAQQTSNAPLRVMFSFYAATVVSAISTPGAVKEAFLASILPFLLRGLKLHYHDYNGATYMIICQLGVSATLKVTLLEPLMEALCQHVSPEMIQQMLGCLAVLCRTQNLKQLPGKVMFQICALPKFLISLAQLSKSHNITPLLSALLPQLTTTAINAEVSEDDQFPEGCEELDLLASLTGILREIHIESQIAVNIARCLLHGYVSACTNGLDDDSRRELREKIAPVVQGLERRFPEAMDLILESYLADGDNDDKQTYVQDFVSMYSGGMKHQLLPESNTSLVLSLNHANPDVRRMAVNHIQNIIQQGGELDSFFQESLLQRLQDDSASVVAAVLQIGESLCELVPVDPMFAALQKLLNKKKKRHGNDWGSMVKGAIKIITSQSFITKAPHLVNDAVAMTIPYIFIAAQANLGLESGVRADIAGSHLVSSHLMMKGLKSVLSSKKKVNESLVTTKILDLFGKNMAAMKQEDMDKTVSSLLSHLEATSKPEAFRLIVVTVFLRTLQHVHGGESKLYMARKLLAVLDIDAMKTCQKSVELIKLEQGEGSEEQDGPLQPTGVPSTELPPQLHTHLSALLTVRRKHRVAGTVYLYSSQVQVMLWALESMVLSLAPSVSALAPDSKWWLPGTKKGPIGGQYVTFVLQLVDLLTQGSSECHLKDGTKQEFRDIVHSVIKNLFSDSTNFLKLLSIGWIGHVIPSQPMGFKPSPLFQVRCLGMGAAIFDSMEQNELNSLLGRESFVLSCLLMALSSHLEPVRSVTIRCLQTIHDGCHGDGVTPYHWLIQRLLKKKESLEIDSRYIKQALRNSLMKANKLPVVTFPKQEKTTPDVKGASSVQAKQCLEWILDYIRQEGIPHLAQRALLQLLDEVDSETVLSSLLGLLQELLVQAFVEEGSLSVDQTHSLQCIVSHMTPATAHLMSDQKSLDLLLEVLSREKPVCEGLASPSEMALKQITGAFFEALPSSTTQQAVLARLIDLQVDTNSSSTANHLAKVIKKLPLNGTQVVKELSQITAGQKPKTVKDARRVRQKSKDSSTEDASQTASSEGRKWQRVMTILENLQQRKLGKMEGRHTIVPALFNILNLCLDLPATDQGSAEYIKQLLLTTILNICDHLGDTEGEETGPLITEEQFSVELVVQCIRTSDNPQTHNHALLLLATAAKLFPVARFLWIGEWGHPFTFLIAFNLPCWIPNVSCTVQGNPVSTHIITFHTYCLSRRVGDLKPNPPCKII